MVPGVDVFYNSKQLTEEHIRFILFCVVCCRCFVSLLHHKQHRPFFAFFALINMGLFRPTQWAFFDMVILYGWSFCMH